jgi:2-polyprenyl-3-methyl-5-hydroxy-6-metoxy-1,4-benzoquinol methylase
MTAQALWLERLEEAANFTRWVGDEIRPFIRGRVLEVGCGSGTYTQLFAQWADAVVAIDIDPSFAAATARRFANNPKVEVQQADAQRLPNMGSFDTIVMLDVLEHIEDDVGTLAALRGMLNEKGSIVLKIPALPQLYGALDAAIGHYRRYTRRSLAETAARANLVLAECRSFNLAAAPGWWLNGRILRRTNPPENQLRLYDRLVPAFRMVDRLTGPPFGTSLIAAARRNDVD